MIILYNITPKQGSFPFPPKNKIRFDHRSFPTEIELNRFLLLEKIFGNCT